MLKKSQKKQWLLKQTDEEVEEAADEEVEEDEKSATETMREYVEKVSATMGDNGANGQSQQ